MQRRGAIHSVSPCFSMFLRFLDGGRISTWRCWESSRWEWSYEDPEVHLEQGWRQEFRMEEDLSCLGGTSRTWWRRFVGRGTDYTNLHEDRSGGFLPCVFSHIFPIHISEKKDHIDLQIHHSNHRLIIVIYIWVISYAKSWVLLSEKPVMTWLKP